MARALPQPTANGNRVQISARAYDRLTLSIYLRLNGGGRILFELAMFRLCYISSSRILIDVAMVDDILAASRRNNRAAGLTGLLVAGQRRFLQLLEGEEQAVRATYQRIRRDPRHFACVAVNEAAIESRQFGDWDMGLVRPGCDGDDYAALATLIAAIDDPNLRAEFTGFLSINGGVRAAA